MVKLISHPLISHKLAILRDEQTAPFQFRMLVDEIASLMIFEATRDLALKKVSVKTPVSVATCERLAERVMICPILRAALGMLSSVFGIIPDASVGFLGFQRNETTLEAEFYYHKLPQDYQNRTAIIIDPMFATGGTAVEAVRFLRNKGVKKVKFVSIIAAPEGLAKFESIFPDVEVFVAAVDESLNEKGYIVPGLGDAGDRVFNTLG